MQKPNFRSGSCLTQQNKTRADISQRIASRSGDILVDSIFHHRKNVQDDALASLVQRVHLSDHLKADLIAAAGTGWKLLPF
jgi:hypothetical protein